MWNRRTVAIFCWLVALPLWPGLAAAAVPGPPIIGLATAGNGQVAVYYYGPDSDGGSPITSYTVTSSPGGLTAGGTVSPLAVNGLTNGTAYTFTVKATNADGMSAASSASNSVTPAANLPTAPVIGTATAGQGQATVPFTESVDDGGSPITAYTTTTYGSSGGWAPDVLASPATVHFLPNGLSYAFIVTAANANGKSIPSALSNAVTPAATVPDIPGIGSATPGNGDATVSFYRSPSDGGSAITAYTITASPGGLTATGLTSPITVTGLTNGTTYTFTVKATNAVGTSAVSSASNGVTPVDNPVRIHVDYTLGQVAGASEIYAATADRSWTTFDPDGAGPLPNGPHLNAFVLYVTSEYGYPVVAGAVIDNPASRTIQAAALPYNQRPKVYVRSLFLQAPWQPGVSYALGAKVSGFSRELISGAAVPAYPNTTGYWTCTRAGTSGQVEPSWTPTMALSAGWESTYAAIAPATWPVNYETWSAGIFSIVLKKPWRSTFAPVSVSPGGALQVLRTDDQNNSYVYLWANTPHGPRYVSRIYDPDKISHQTVATKVIQDPDSNGVEWTYTADLSAWAFEGELSGAVTVKEAVSSLSGAEGRYVEHGDAYLRAPQ